MGALKKAGYPMTPISNLPPRYRFILNPYEDARFSSCPACGRRTLLRKVPLFIHVEPLNPVLLNKRCRYCPDCDLLIVHQDELETQLTLALQESHPEVIGNEYLVLGSVDKAVWRKRQKDPLKIPQIASVLHTFKAYMGLMHTPTGWVSTELPPISPEAPSPALSGGPALSETDPVTTIDDPEQANRLLKQMESQLPIPAEIRKGTAMDLRAQGVVLPPHRNVKINGVLYHGDEGGIVCGISPPSSEEAIVISLTHLKISYRHPLEKEIRAYQKTRLRRLKAQD
jgi:hypothetical protein